jgi:hypothetical protein
MPSEGTAPIISKISFPLKNPHGLPVQASTTRLQIITHYRLLRKLLPEFFY